MTPKQQVAVMVGLFSALGIGVSVGIIAFGGGFAGGNASSIFSPPTAADIYVVGAQVKDGMSMGYTVDKAQGQDTSLANADVSITFHKAGDNNSGWRATFDIVNGTQGAPRQQFDIMYSKELTKEGGVSASVRPYLDPIEASILAIRDMDYGGRDKYLVVGAPWSTIVTGSTTPITVRVIDEEKVTTPAGTFDAMVLGYKLNNNTSKIYVVKDLPMPVKAETYDVNDQPYYKYELVSVTR
ncbi:MAG TPA: hypothetical protein VHA09_09120 [Nitrososphaera sp.]|nr:hypothetical protein [Nitrososphaera sp.]